MWHFGCSKSKNSSVLFGDVDSITARDLSGLSHLGPSNAPESLHSAEAASLDQITHAVSRPCETYTITYYNII